MEPLVLHFVSVLAGGEPPGSSRTVYIVVPRSRPYLADLLAKATQERNDVEIIVDRRRRERRTLQQPVVNERRRAERRHPKEEVVEVVLGAIDRSGGSPEGLA